jgi:hypothetical protein
MPLRSDHRNPKTKEEHPEMDENTRIRTFGVEIPQADLDYL